MRRQPAQFPQEGLGFFGARSVLRAVRWRRCPKGKFRKLFQSRLGYWEVKGAYMRKTVKYVRFDTSRKLD